LNGGEIKDEAMSTNRYYVASSSQESADTFLVENRYMHRGQYMKIVGSWGRSFFGFMGLLAVGLCAGCSGGGGDAGGGAGGGGGSAQAGVLSVSLTDAPACGFDEVNVTVSRVRVHQSDSANENAAGWTDITLNPPRRINLLNLNDATQSNLALESLGETPLAAGHYTQLRLVLVENNGSNPPANSVVLSGPPRTEIALATPSAIQSGIKLIHQFDVGAGQRVDLLLDFDACKSIVRRGNGTYGLKPVIKVVPFVLNGIEGFVDTALLGGHVVVSAQFNSAIVRATVPNANTGRFLLARLDPANYDVVITADGRATKVIAGVPVASTTSITAISTNAMPAPPITLQPSTSQSINGTVALNPADDDGAVIVAATQSLTGGPIVTVRSQVATVLTSTPQTGDYEYNLTLPIAKPWLGSYSTPLPILFTEQPIAVAGVYIVHGSAQTATVVYATQTPSPSSVNIAGGNTTQTFTLTP
jgi:hypothetical protein